MAHRFKTSPVALAGRTGKMTLTLSMEALAAALKTHQLSHQARPLTLTKLNQLSYSH